MTDADLDREALLALVAALRRRIEWLEQRLFNAPDGVRPGTDFQKGG